MTSRSCSTARPACDLQRYWRWSMEPGWPTRYTSVAVSVPGCGRSTRRSLRTDQRLRTDPFSSENWVNPLCWRVTQGATCVRCKESGLTQVSAAQESGYDSACHESHEGKTSPGTDRYRGLFCGGKTQIAWTWSACGPFGPWVVWNSTRWPSSSVRNPVDSIAL